jgi:membrane protein DedA with SNARE-associated domain
VDLDWITEIIMQLTTMDGSLWLLAWTALFFFMMTEEIGLPAPLVSNTIVLALGYDAGIRGQAVFLTFMMLQITVIGSSIAGASIIYWIGRAGARPLVDRLARGRGSRDR